MRERMAVPRPAFSEWCHCVRLLLGWAAGTPDAWPDLYAAGVTPLEAARRTIFGELAIGD